MGWEMSKEGPIDNAGFVRTSKSFAESILSGDVVVKHQKMKVSDSKDIPF